MKTADYLAMLREAGLPTGLPLREIDEWVSGKLGVNERTAREWRLRGSATRPAIAALRSMAAARL
jgi:hypothetical protein